jgi:hypothetical protein
MINRRDKAGVEPALNGCKFSVCLNPLRVATRRIIAGACPKVTRQSFYPQVDRARAAVLGDVPSQILAKTTATLAVH